jgi:hypothetical protein
VASCILADRTPVDASDTAIKICTDRWMVLRVIGATVRLSKECICGIWGHQHGSGRFVMVIGVLILAIFTRFVVSMRQTTLREAQQRRYYCARCDSEPGGLTNTLHEHCFNARYNYPRRTSIYDFSVQSCKVVIRMPWTIT